MEEMICCYFSLYFISELGTTFFGGGGGGDLYKEIVKLNLQNY